MSYDNEIYCTVLYSITCSKYAGRRGLAHIPIAPDSIIEGSSRDSAIFAVSVH